MTDGIDPRARAAQRRRQITTLRKRVAAVAALAFIALWAGLFVQLTTGHDPGLNTSAAAALVQSADPDAASTDASGTTDDVTAQSDDVLTDDDDDDDSWASPDTSEADASSAGSASGPDAGAVVTRQS